MDDLWIYDRNVKDFCHKGCQLTALQSEKTPQAYLCIFKDVACKHAWKFKTLTILCPDSKYSLIVEVRLKSLK